MIRIEVAFAVVLVLAACGSSSTSTTDGGASDAGPAADAGAPTEIRDTRYCEILVGKITGSQVHVDVYNTEGLNDCPEAAWSMINAGQVQTAVGADFVVLNGPRYWMIDSLSGSSLIDTTPTTLGGIAMRQAGAIDFMTSELAALQKPYALHTIQRQTSFTFLAGKPVYELVDPQAHVYTMQSYSLQKDATETADTLPGLGAKLTLPAGWSFRTRTLTQDLDVLSANGTATVTTDDFENTYLQSQ
jgi:hypothetical protein